MSVSVCGVWAKAAVSVLLRARLEPPSFNTAEPTAANTRNSYGEQGGSMRPHTHTRETRSRQADKRKKQHSEAQVTRRTLAPHSTPAPPPPRRARYSAVVTLRHASVTPHDSNDCSSPFRDAARFH